MDKVVVEEVSASCGRSVPHKPLHVVGESEMAKHPANDQTDSYTENQIVCSVRGGNASVCLDLPGEKCYHAGKETASN